VNIGNHGTDISCTVWRFGGVGVFDGVEIVDDGWVKVHGVAFIEGVDLSAGGDLDLDCEKQNAQVGRYLRTKKHTSGWVRINSPSEASSV
jgi:hypothetical protein